MTPTQTETRLAAILEKLRDWKAMTRSETLLLLAEYQEVFKAANPAFAGDAIERRLAQHSTNPTQEFVVVPEGLTILLDTTRKG